MTFDGNVFTQVNISYGVHFLVDLSTLLKALKMEKYEEIFQNEEIDLDLLLTMSEEEFAEIGITTLGARRRLSNAIKGPL